MKEHADTRSRIQEVALELFTEQGYEATSLREIAERLSVTKAALYYHFKTKEDIVASLMEDRAEALQELVDWAQTQPRTIEMRREFVRRYAAELIDGRHTDVMRFLERNQTALRGHPKSEQMRETMMQVMDLLSSKDDPMAVQIKSSLAIFALHAGWFIVRDRDISDGEQAAAALEVALELIDAGAPARPAEATA
jgi:AcrR family transcriptional regulator